MSVPISEKDSSVFLLFGKEYFINGEQIISDTEATIIYEKLTNDVKK